MFRYPFRLPFRHPLRLSFVSAKSLSDLPPAYAKLLVWSDGNVILGADIIQDPDAVILPDTIDSTDQYRQDLISGYHLLITPGIDPITDTWDGADATYTAPEVAEFIAQDLLENGEWWFTAGVANPRTEAEILARFALENASFFCDNLLLYSEVLTGQELTDTQEWIVC